MENWKYNATHSGTPQGGIISPLLANIYLHELDEFVIQMANDFYLPQKQVYTTEYGTMSSRITRMNPKINAAEGEERARLIQQKKRIEKTKAQDSKQISN